MGEGIGGNRERRFGTCDGRMVEKEKEKRRGDIKGFGISDKLSAKNITVVDYRLDSSPPDTGQDHSECLGETKRWLIKEKGFYEGGKQ